MNIVQAAADLLWSPVLRKFPDLKVSLSEGGIGWIPYFLERMDWIYKRHHGWTGQDFGDRLPSEVFREHIVTCFIDDPAGIALRDQVGIDTICWEADYPHSDSTWPVSPERLMQSLDGVPDDEIDEMTHRTPCVTSASTPSRCGPSEQCTVGALRAQGRRCGRDDEDLRRAPLQQARDGFRPHRAQGAGPLTQISPGRLEPGRRALSSECSTTSRSTTAAPRSKRRSASVSPRRPPAGDSTVRSSSSLARHTAFLPERSTTWSAASTSSSLPEHSRSSARR